MCSGETVKKKKSGDTRQGSLEPWVNHPFPLPLLTLCWADDSLLEQERSQGEGLGGIKIAATRLCRTAFNGEAGSGSVEGDDNHTSCCENQAWGLQNMCRYCSRNAALTTVSRISVSSLELEDGCNGKARFRCFDLCCVPSIAVRILVAMKPFTIKPLKPLYSQNGLKKKKKNQLNLHQTDRRSGLRKHLVRFDHAKMTQKEQFI